MDYDLTKMSFERRVNYDNMVSVLKPLLHGKLLTLHLQYPVDSECQQLLHPPPIHRYFVAQHLSTLKSCDNINTTG